MPIRAASARERDAAARHRVSGAGIGDERQRLRRAVDVHDGAIAIDMQHLHALEGIADLDRDRLAAVDDEVGAPARRHRDHLYVGGEDARRQEEYPGGGTERDATREDRAPRAPFGMRPRVGANSDTPAAAYAASTAVMMHGGRATDANVLGGERAAAGLEALHPATRSEERRVGKECRSRW